MPAEQTLYIEQKPGDLITAEKWNELQRRVQADIRAQVGEAVAEIVSVPESGDSEKLDGRTYQELADEIVRRAVAEANARSGSVKLFLKLKVGRTRLIEHGLGNCPLVDVYQLQYFPVVCCEDKDTYPAWTTFYAFHSGEKRIRYTTSDNEKGTIEIVQASGPAFQVPFKEMLERYGVQVDGGSALSDVLNELWKALFAPPNDAFDDDQYCHSPWFEKCCREEMSLRDVMKKGHWDDLWIQFRPRKTIHLVTGLLTNAADPPPIEHVMSHSHAPQNLLVDQYDFNTLGVTLLSSPMVPDLSTAKVPPGLPSKLPSEAADELDVMLLLKG